MKNHTDRHYTTDNKQSEKLTWTFSSDELKKEKQENRTQSKSLETWNLAFQPPFIQQFFQFISEMKMKGFQTMVICTPRRIFLKVMGSFYLKMRCAWVFWVVKYWIKTKVLLTMRMLVRYIYLALSLPYCMLRWWRSGLERLPASRRLWVRIPAATDLSSDK